MPDLENNPTILDQILLEVRALKAEMERIAAEVESIDNRLAKVEHFLTGYIPQ